MKQISSDIEGAVGISFKGIWLLIVNWNEIPEYGGLASNVSYEIHAFLIKKHVLHYHSAMHNYEISLSIALSFLTRW